jgi:DNA-directed RNA polymerase subunit RPC12/RpoP
MSTITAVVLNPGTFGVEFDVEVSCGHNYRSHTRVSPPVGASYDCSRCSMEEWERAHPPLSDEVLEAIEASLPHCPTCNGKIDEIPFVKQTTQKFDYELDSHAGAVRAWSDHYDTKDEDPDWTQRPTLEMTKHGWQYVGGTIEVTCENNHSWIESRLIYVYDQGLHEHRWHIQGVKHDTD